MARTLGCLVGAMTVGAVVLHWIQPSGAPGDTRYEIQLIAREVKQVVRQDTTPASFRWQGIRVHAFSESVPKPCEPHFSVTALGKPLTSDEWRRQQASDATGFIEIAVDVSGLRDEQLPPRQLDTLLLLLRELQRNYVVAGGGEVRLDEQSFASNCPNGRKLVSHIEVAFRSLGL